MERCDAGEGGKRGGGQNKRDGATCRQGMGICSLCSAKCDRSRVILILSSDSDASLASLLSLIHPSARATIGSGIRTAGQQDSNQHGPYSLSAAPSHPDRLQLLSTFNMSMSKNSELLVDDLVAKLKRRQLVGSSAVAQATLKLLIVVISKNNWTTSKQLLTLVKSVGQRLNLANPTELAVGNIIRRVLHIIREEFREAAGHVDSPKDGSHHSSGHPHQGQGHANGLNEFAPLSTSSSMYNLLGETGASSDDDVQYPTSLRSNIIQEIREVKDELENIYDNIKSQASLHIHSK